jgi:simple sugar transport system ATP-binding protein
MAGGQALLEARGISKRFGHVEALRGADFEVHDGEVVALMGDNGAGKSTLVKTLSGVLAPDAGEIWFAGERLTLTSAEDARRRGIETVYQDLALADTLDPPANLFLGRELVRKGLWGRLGFLDHGAMRAQASQAFDRLGVTVRAEHSAVGSLSGGQRQGVAVCRAVMWASRVLFMDEPTAALGVTQSRNVLELIKRVRSSGVAVVLISHSVPEVLAVADRIEVMRLGRRVARLRAADATTESVVAAITGAGTEDVPDEQATVDGGKR